MHERKRGEKQADEKYFSFDVIRFPRGFISHLPGSLSRPAKKSPCPVFILTSQLSKLHNKWTLIVQKSVNFFPRETACSLQSALTDSDVNE
jgi:hypothetical protein